MYGKDGGVAWRATPVRVWRSVDASSPTSQTRSRTQVIHDGLFVRAAFPTGVGRQLRLADRAAGEAIRARSRPVRAAMGTLPESPASGDAAFDAHLVSLTDEPADVAALSIDARRVLVAVVERLGRPVRVAVNADGIGLAFPNRGTFRGLSASEEMDTPLRRQTAEESVRDMTTRFAADAELLATIPEAVTRLHQALAVREAGR